MANLPNFIPVDQRAERLRALLLSPPQSFPLFQQRQEFLRGFQPSDRPQGLDSDFDVLGQFLSLLENNQGGNSGIDPFDNQIHLGDRFKTFAHPTSPNPFTGERSVLLDLIDMITNPKKKREAMEHRSNALRDALSGTPLTQ